MGTYQNYKGTKDYLPLSYANNNYSSELFRYVEKVFIDTCNSFGCDEIILPILEFSKMYNRGIGETTDIVQKEMFMITDDSNQEVALRPEGTASVIRSYIQSKAYVTPNEVAKLYYKGSMFRKERPQAGRQREFNQLGVEFIGEENPAIDAEMIALVSLFLKNIGIKNIDLQINSIGCNICRENYKIKLIEYLSTIDELCEDCNKRLEKNTLRILDCKNEVCKSKVKNPPLISDYLCNECVTDYDNLKKYLNILEISYTENPRLVRGLDYYSKTAFEFIETSIGAQSTFCGGGRYNSLVEQLGGPPKTGVGCAIGLERILIILENQKNQMNLEKQLDYYLIWTNEETLNVQIKIAMNLRSKGYRVEMEYTPKKLKSQLKVADRKKAKNVLILGEDEYKLKIISIKDLETGIQTKEKLENFL